MVDNDISEIKKRLNNIDWQLGDIRKDMQGIRLEIQPKFDAIMNAVDNISKQLTNEKTEKTAIDHSLNRHEQRIDDHKNRISHLEKKTA